MKKVKVTQTKSTIGRTERQKRTLVALGLTRIGKSSIHEVNSQISGMITKVNHLIKVEEVEG